ncbi:MAG: sulfite exporter TauE/SafE family protein, partial [Chloroflexi bacterium]|nr:sulfite exporter TauE/SafE family protein [Chloroflexota bacterium]
EGLIDYKMALILFGGNYVGVRLGARTLGWLNGMSSISLVNRQAPAGEVYTLLIFAVLLIGIAAWMFVDTSRPSAEEPHQGLFARLRIPPYTRFPSVGETPLSIPILSYFGLALGFLTGLLGIGGGVILLPALVYLVGMRTHCAAATSLVIVWLTSFVATITHSLAGNTDLLLAVPLLVGGSLGLQVGVNICNRTRGARLRRYFCFVVLTAIVLIVGKLGVLALF